MKKTLLLATALLAGVAFTATAQHKFIDIGTAIPMSTTKMEATDGKTVTLDKAKTDKGLLVMFSCNTCPYVIKSQARTKEMMDYAAEKGIGMVVINSNEAKRDGDDSKKAMTKYAKKEKYTAPYVIDNNSAVADAFGATRTPEVFLFDASGKLVYKGAMEDQPTNPSESKELFLKDAIDNMLSGKPIDPNTTKSIGCTIKRAS
ncbi:MAG: thioredoxin family protein [Flavipsychrobacter sp.]